MEKNNCSNAAAINHIIVFLAILFLWIFLMPL